MKIREIIFLVVICFGALWSCLKYGSYTNSKAEIFVVSTEDCGWNTLVEKPVRINDINNIWQISFSREGKRLVAFGNSELPTKHWEIGDEVFIVSAKSDPSAFFSSSVYFFNNHRKKK
ncbi:MAG: hypothetical protein WCJ74_01405 [bacterium]